MARLGRDHIGPYRLLKLIRAGSRTHIWEAMNSLDHHRVALKSLQPEYCRVREDIAGLRHEYHVGRQLEHPNVNLVFEFNISRGMPYIVMEYFDAPNLKQSRRQYPERVEEYLDEIVRQTAAGLGHMHEKGWVHRDVKPDNFLMNEVGEVKLIDFAIAQKPKSGLGKLFAGKSKVMGTRSYMSPEQIRGLPVDQRADIYSLACVLYEIFSSKPPFTGTNSDDLLNKHLRAPPPPLTAVCDTVTSEFSQLLSSMMSKKPEGRPESIGEFFRQLDGIRIFKGRRQPSGGSKKENTS